MVHIPDKFNLSERAFAELKIIAKDEYGETLSDEEIHDMGFRLLHLFDLLQPKETIEPGGRIQVTEQEQKVLTYIRDTLDAGKTFPSVRDIARAAGFRSSRSGFRMLQKLIKKGLVKRDEEGEAHPKNVGNTPFKEQHLCT